MLAKQYRFHGYNSLRFVYTKGTTVRTKYISLKFVKNDRQQNSRLAVVVAKKITKKAPVRNRIRRRLYEHVRLHWPMIKQGYDLVITVFDERVSTIPSEELNKQVVQLLTKANLYKD